MKKYIQSYRLFFGNCQIRSIVSFAAVITGLTVLCGIIGCFPMNESSPDWLRAYPQC